MISHTSQLGAISKPYSRCSRPLGLFNCPGYRGVLKAHVGHKNAYSNEKEILATQKSVAKFLDNFNASHECREVTCLYNPMNWWIEKAINGELDIAEFDALDEQFDYYF